MHRIPSRGYLGGIQSKGYPGGIQGGKTKNRGICWSKSSQLMITHSHPLTLAHSRTRVLTCSHTRALSDSHNNLRVDLRARGRTNAPLSSEPWRLACASLLSARNRSGPSAIARTQRAWPKCPKVARRVERNRTVDRIATVVIA
eukprot:9333775-Pyramimonas_sp.AAC.1